MVETQQEGPLSTQRAHKRRRTATYRRDIEVESDEGLLEAAPPPQFCSKHGRWVETILQHCTDQAEALSPAPASPLLFLSSSSGSSSDDLTPSNLVPQRAPSQSSGVYTSDEGWADDASQTRGPLQPFSSARITPTNGSRDLFAPPQASPDDSTIHEGARDGGTPMQTVTLVSQQPPTPKPEASTVFSAAKRPLQPLHGDSFEAPSTGFMTSCASSSSNGGGSEPLVSTCTPDHASPSAESSPSDAGSCRRPQRLSAPVSPDSTDASLPSDPVRRPQLKMSLSCQATLLQSKLFQPYVSLTRLSAEQRSSPPGGGEEEHPCGSFDPNTLYSSYSSSSGGDDSLIYDPDYKPSTTKKQLLLEYEAARTLT